MRTVDRNVYGTRETNGLVDGPSYHEQRRDVTVRWNDPRLARVVRLRLLSEPGYPMWDVSYCHGVLRDGTLCNVELPFNQLSKRRMRSEIVEYAKSDKVYALTLGVFNAISTLN